LSGKRWVGLESG